MVEKKLHLPMLNPTERARLTIARAVNFAQTHFYLSSFQLTLAVGDRINKHTLNKFLQFNPPVRLDNTIRHIYPIANFR